MYNPLLIIQDAVIDRYSWFQVSQNGRIGSGNHSLVTEFILLGFTVPPQIRLVLFLLFLIIYVFTIVANTLIITVTQLFSQLHSPMYFFICNLSFLDICFLSSSIPTCLKGFLSTRNTITFSGCVVQMYIGLTLGITQGILLAVMAWDRYAAICKPLNYQQIMRKQVCTRLVIVTWTSGFLFPVAHVSFTMIIPLCGHNKINHVVCELAAVLRLACADTRLAEVVIFAIAIVVLVAPLTFIIVSYVQLIGSILRLPTSTSRHKAFSTCSSHLTVVTLFYGTLFVVYLKPKSASSGENEKIISVFYGIVAPALNPLIYTLRNKEVKGAIKRLLLRRGMI